jgi:NAD(P)-dependent dehydrogenase (short-subunit alcohol dehydrogenase family)
MIRDDSFRNSIPREEVAMENERVAIVFGGSAGIGEATAGVLSRDGVRTTIVGRNEAKLRAAAGRHSGVATAVADARDRQGVRRFFASFGPIDYLVICVTGAKGAGAFRDLDLDELRAGFEEKTFAQLAVAQAAVPHVRAGGSITFVSAATTRSVIRGTTGLAAINGALESMIPILAHELAPVRVNAVTPGIIDTTWWDDAMPEDAKRAFFSRAETTLPVRRVGRPEEVAALIALVAQSGFMTGSIYEIDGGGHLITQ